MAKQYPEQWSLIEIQCVGGEMLSLNVPVSPGIADHLTQAMSSTGFLTLRNDKQAISIATSRVVAFRITLITGE
jgi:hypothetical protein